MSVLQLTITRKNFSPVENLGIAAELTDRQGDTRVCIQGSAGFVWVDINSPIIYLPVHYIGMYKHKLRGMSLGGARGCKEKDTPKMSPYFAHHNIIIKFCLSSELLEVVFNIESILKFNFTLFGAI